MRAESLVSLQSYWSIQADAWCKWAPNVSNFQCFFATEGHVPEFKQQEQQRLCFYHRDYNRQWYHVQCSLGSHICTFSAFLLLEDQHVKLNKNSHWRVEFSSVWDLVWNSVCIMWTIFVSSEQCRCICMWTVSVSVLWTMFLVNSRNTENTDNHLFLTLNTIIIFTTLKAARSVKHLCTSWF